MIETLVDGTKVRIAVGDITKEETEAIVNAANSSLMGGGGVDGAIHRAGGPQILEECREIRLQEGMCPPGQAVITSGGNLKAKYVIHTVGPIWRGGNGDEDRVLSEAYRNSLHLALKKKIKSIAFPSISTGAYRFPIERAARIALLTIIEFIKDHPGELQEIKMVLYTEKDFQIYSEIWRELI